MLSIIILLDIFQVKKEVIKMKKLLVVVLCLIVCSGLCACKNKPAKKEESATSATQQSSDQQKSSSDKKQNQQQSKTVHVIRSFNAIQGAVIYDISYDSYGYPSSCHFHKKCEACGDVSNNNGQARSNLTTSYHCIKCGNNQRVEIKADEDWVTVND